VWKQIVYMVYTYVYPRQVAELCLALIAFTVRYSFYHMSSRGTTQFGILLMALRIRRNLIRNLEILPGISRILESRIAAYINLPGFLSILTFMWYLLPNMVNRNLWIKIGILESSQESWNHAEIPKGSESCRRISSVSDPLLYNDLRIVYSCTSTC